MADQKDPLLGHSFALQIDGTEIARFRECSGIESEIEVIEEKAVDAQGRPVILKLPGNVKLAPITLKRGGTADKGVYEWHQEALGKNIEGSKKEQFLSNARRTASIVEYDVTGAESKRYNLKRAWCSKFKGGELNATANNVLVEEITIVHEGLNI